MLSAYFDEYIFNFPPTLTLSRSYFRLFHTKIFLFCNYNTVQEHAYRDRCDLRVIIYHDAA